MAGSSTLVQPALNSREGLSRIAMLNFDVCSDAAEKVVADIADHVLTAPDDARGEWLACLNPHSYAELKKRPELREEFGTARWIVPDGAGIVLASRYTGKPVAGRVTGADIFYGLNGSLEQAEHGRVFFLGSSKSTLDKIRKKFERDYKHLELVGVYSPPYKLKFTAKENAEMVANDVVEAKRSKLLRDHGLEKPHAIENQG